jgi:hypothetical protein
MELSLSKDSREYWDVKWSTSSRGVLEVAGRNRYVSIDSSSTEKESPRWLTEVEEGSFF